MDKKAAPGQNRKKITISVEKGKRLRQQYRQLLESMKKSHEQFETSKQDTYYLVSTKFLRQIQQFCQSQQQQRYQPGLYNVDLFQPNGSQLRKGLSQGADFQILSSDVFEAFKDFKGKRLLRKARMVGNQKRVQIYLRTYKVLQISNSQLKLIDQGDLKFEAFQKKLENVQQSQQATVKQFCENLIDIYNLSQNSRARLWRLGKDFPIKKVFDHIKEELKPVSYFYECKIKFIGKRIEDQDSKLVDLNIQEEEYFVFEHKMYTRDWYFQADNQGKCQNCYQIRKLPFPCACKKVAYCTQNCKEKDKRYHLARCSYAQQEQLNQKIQMAITSNSQKGLVGLSNLGNTCFMNSCLQCLSNTTPLTQYFLNSHYQDEINKQNPLGSKGKLAKCYAKFIKGMWCDQSQTFSPYSLKAAVSTINPMFSGYAQHDSQQFFSFLVDGLHQDLNRVQKKPYVQTVESKGRQDKIVALQSWITHIKRNQSIIVDLMTGQYKSKVICPDCKFQSITFDPFITVTLPIPQQIVFELGYFVIHHNFEKQTKKMSFKYKKATVEQWETNGAELINTNPNLIKFYVLTMSESIYKVGKTPISEIINKIENDNKHLFLLQFSQEQINFQNPIEFTARCSKKSNYFISYESLWFKFPLIFQKKTFTGKAIYIRILQFLYNTAYDGSPKKDSNSGKSYQDYQKEMLQKRPFALFLRYHKKIEKYYYKTQYKFEDERQIKDNTTLQQILQDTDFDDCQIDARFSKESLRDFTFEQLKNFKDTTSRHSKGYKQSCEDITVTLEQCLQNLRQPEQLQQGNQWYCAKCKDHKLATKQIDIYKAPKILILHLKRFKQKGSYRKQKNESKVIFPMNFDFSPYLIDPKPMSTYKQEALKQNVLIKPAYQQQNMNIGKAEYELYAVSNHYGGLGGGHYTAYGKNNNQWYEFNDSSVRSCSQSSVCSSGAYILFYKRKD